MKTHAPSNIIDPQHDWKDIEAFEKWWKSITWRRVVLLLFIICLPLIVTYCVLLWM